MSLPPFDLIGDVEKIIKKSQLNDGLVASSDINDNDAVVGLYSSMLKEIMLQYSLIAKATAHSGYVLTERGRQFESIAKEDEHAANVRKKLSVDLINAERVYKTYKSTRLIAWVTFAIALLLALLRLAEALKLWPFHK